MEMTVNENISFWKNFFHQKLISKEINSLLRIFISHSKIKTQSFQNLSYGEIKKLELCRLVIEQKKLWILDEPYIGLDQ